MPTFAELLSRFSFLASTPAAVTAVIAAGLIVVFFDWRLLVLSFAVFAIAAGLLFSNVLPPQVAGLKMLVGLLIAVQMFVTGRQVEGNKATPVAADTPAEGVPLRRRLTTGLPFRLVVVVMILLTSWQASLTPTFTLPDVSSIVSLAVIGLVAMGLLGLGLTEEPIKAGMLLIAMLTGFELYYAAVEPALAVMALLAAMNFAIALAACYLAVIKKSSGAEPNRMIVPLIFLAVPLVMAAIAYALRSWVWAQVVVASLTAAALTLLAVQVPLNTVAVFLGRDVAFNPSWVVLGRSFTFSETERPALIFIYLTSLVFFLVAGSAKASHSFLPVGLLTLSLMAATIFVQPFLFAALFIEMIAAFAVLLISDNEHRNTRGAMRLLVFVTLAVPFILLAGWQLEGVATSPEDTSLLVRATLMLNIGLLILLAVVPFHSWIPNVADEASPIASAFVFTVVQASVLFFMLKFFAQYDWMRNNPAEFAALRLGGAALVLVGGIMSFAQRRFGRLMGYAVMVDLGATLLAVSVAGADGLRVALSIVALRGLGLAVWGIGLGWIREHSHKGHSDDFEDVQGLAWEMPFATGALILGGLSLAAVPLTAGFTSRWALFRLLAADDFRIALLLLAASVSVMLAYARGIAALFQRPPVEEGVVVEPVGPREGQAAMVFLSLGMVAVVVLGIFPQWLLPAVTQAAGAFVK